MPVPLVQSVRCNNCGAPLQIPQAARFVTCQHCKAELQVEHTSDVVYTKVIEEVQKRVEETQKQLTRLAVQQLIDRLDSEWDNERREILGTDREPDLESNHWFWLIPGGFIIIALWMAISEGIFILGFTAMCAAALLLNAFNYHTTKQNRYCHKLAIYRGRRLELQHTISPARPTLRKTDTATLADMISHFDDSV